MPDTPIGTLEAAPDASAPDLYEVDEHEWIASQIEALRSGRLDLLDRPHLMEFLGDMARRDRRELRSRITVLLIHLLKVRFQPELLSLSWVRTILEQQSEIRSFLSDIPSLAREADTFFRDAFPIAVKRAARETHLPISNFPTECPWTVAEALSFDPPEPATRYRRR
jgi:hypothetical protein